MTTVATLNRRDFGLVWTHLLIGVADELTVNLAIEAVPEAISRALATEHPGRVILAVDAKDGHVATDGWTQVSETTAVELVRAFAGVPLGAILYTLLRQEKEGLSIAQVVGTLD